MFSEKIKLHQRSLAMNFYSEYFITYKDYCCPVLYPYPFVMSHGLHSLKKISVEREYSTIAYIKRNNSKCMISNYNSEPNFAFWHAHLALTEIAKVINSRYL